VHLKADFHLHTGDDPLDYVAHSSREMIDHAAALGFEVMAITNHDFMSHSEELSDYARSRGVVLVPGVEATIENRHVLLFDFDYWAAPPHTFDDLYRLKRTNPQMIVVAPHPFFPSQFCLQRRLYDHLELFHGIEYSHFYTRKMNFNKRAVSVARRTGRFLIGTSDSHFLWQMGGTFTRVEAKEKSLPAVLDALRRGRVEVESDPLPARDVLKRIRKYPSLKVKRLAVKQGYGKHGILSLR
jgi:predicted metal-dependent phosphoesterase TrpH